MWKVGGGWKEERYQPKKGGGDQKGSYGKLRTHPTLAE